MNRFIIFTCLILLFEANCGETTNDTSVSGDKFTVIKQWKQIEFEYDSETERQQDIASGAFVPLKSIPLDVDVHYSAVSNVSKVFVAIPRFQAGSPATLVTVTESYRDGNPLVAPYPDWSWHRNLTQCRTDRLVSVFRVMIDRCNRLWVVDTGKYISTQICPPQVLAFDLETNSVVYQQEIPVNLMYDLSLLVTTVVDVRDTCEDTFIYAAECKTNYMFVHDVKNRKTWRVQDKTFYPDPAYGTFNIYDGSFELMDGLLGMALEPYVSGEDRKLFYHALSSGSEQYVSTAQLRNFTRFQTNPSSSPQIFIKYKGSRGTQSAAQAMSQDGILFFSLVGDLTMACFNIRDRYGYKSIDVIASNPATLQFPAGVKIIKDSDNIEQLWIITNRYQKLKNGNLSPNETNFRIMTGKVEDLIEGTCCKKIGY